MERINISKELSELFDYSEIYCSASCCGLQAFEIHRCLLIRKVIDKNIDGSSGIDWYNLIKVEIDRLYNELKNTSLNNEVDIPVFYYENNLLPAFSLPKNELEHFFLRWQRVFRQAKGTTAIP